jgi:hypothetical protein
VVALIWMRRDRGQPGAEVVLLRGVEIGTAARDVLTDEHGLRRNVENASAGGSPSGERHRGVQVTLVEPVEVHLEDAADMGLVIWSVIPWLPVNLDGAVVAWGIAVSPTRLGHRHRAGDNQDQKSGEENEKWCKSTGPQIVLLRRVPRRFRLGVTFTPKGNLC